MSEIVEKLDDLGWPAWIGLMVLSFILFWPLGLAILAYLLWSGRMGCGRYAHGAWSEQHRERWERKMARMREKMERWGSGAAGSYSETGNRAFDEYRAGTLKRLEEESREFREFLSRLRMAKDRAEFDQFMAERRAKNAGGPSPAPEAPQN